MDGYAFVTGDWSRIFFMSFYIMTMIVITIVVAFILEAFLFRIQYKNKMGDIDSKSIHLLALSSPSHPCEYHFTSE